MKNNNAFRLLPVAAGLYAALPLSALAATAVLTADATLNASSPGTNYGSSATLSVSPNPATTGNASLLRFDLSGLPSNLTSGLVNKATLSLWVATLSGSGTLDAREVASSSPTWTEAGVTQNGFGTTSTVASTSRTAALGTAKQWVTVDVTDMVKDWLDTPSSNLGLYLQANVTASFDSKESSTTSHPPVLEIDTTGSAVASFTGSLAGDVSGTQSATVVGSVGGSTAADLHSAEAAANAATDVNTPGTLVRRNANGDFTAGIITAALNGTATGFTGALAGDVSGTQSATVVGSVGGSTAANLHSAEAAANAATDANTPSTLVKRDASGNFTAGTLTADRLGLGAAPSTTSAALEITSTTQGLLAPRLTTAQRGAIVNPANGLLVYDIDVQAFEVYDAVQAAWKKLDSGSVASLSVTAPLTNSGTATAPALSLSQANATTAGYLSAADWSAFNSKGSGTVTSVTGTSPISVATGTITPAISIAKATGTTNGYLSSTDWTTFNNKGSGTVTSVSVSGLPFSVVNPTTTPVISLSGTWSDSQVADALTISGGTVDNTVIGGTTPAAGAFTALKVTGGTPASGKVLVSDASGNATWQATTWNLTGNSGTTAGTNFIGTTDNVSLTFKANSQKAGYVSPSSNETAFGYQALNANTGARNSAFGYIALSSNTTGTDNTATGSGALYSNTTGTNNTAHGSSALYYNTTGTNNTAHGSTALQFNTTGIQNTATGYRAMISNNTGNYNVANGAEALRTNADGVSNVAVGYGTLYFNTSGNNNTAIGYQAGLTNTTGTNNTFIGYGATASGNNYTNATAIGNGASVTASNKVRIGNSSVTEIGGQVGWSNLSDGRFKTNIRPSHKGLDFILKLRPVTYQWKEGDTKTVFDGFIAQDVEKTMQELSIGFSGLHKPENDKDHYSLEYSTFVVPLVNAVKEQQTFIGQETATNKQQATEIAALKQQVAELSALIKQLNVQSKSPAKTAP